MNRRIRNVVALGLGVAILSSGAIGASASTGVTDTSSTGGSILSFLRGSVLEVTEHLGIEDGAAAPGTIDDGKDLLPQASVSLEDAITAARASVEGDLGEVDLERYQGRLVFNIDIGNHDVKIDAETGLVIGSGIDD